MLTAERPIVMVEFSPSGGLFQFAVQLGNALADAGNRVTLVTGYHPELESSHPGFTILPVLPTWHPDTAVVVGVRRKLRRVVRAARLVIAWLVLVGQLVRLRPSAVLWSYWRFTFEPLFVVLIRALLHVPAFGIVAHEPLPKSDEKDTSEPKSGWLLNRAFGAAWRRMDVVFVLGPHARDVVLRHWQPAGKVITIPHGDARALAGDVPQPVAAADTGPVALFFGVWSGYKGIDVLLEAFALVRRRLPEAQLVMAGQVGADIDMPGLLARAEAVGNINARPGYVPIGDVSALLESARVVVAPYVRASQSGVAHLAHTYGRPVIATTVGDIPTVVINGETGLLVPPRNEARLADALLTLLTAPEMATRLGEAGRRRLATESSWDVVAEQVADNLRSAAAKRGGR